MTQNSINNSASELQVDNLNLDGNTISTTNTDGNLILTPDGTGVTSTSKDIYTSGVSFDSGTNLLHNYEEGSFTPTIQFGGASVGVTYSIQVGRYVRVGNVLQVYCEIFLSNKGSSTGSVRIIGFDGLVSSGLRYPYLALYTLGVTYPAGRTMAWVLARGTFGAANAGWVRTTGTGLTEATVLDSGVTNTSQFICTGSYLIS